MAGTVGHISSNGTAVFDSFPCCSQLSLTIKSLLDTIIDSGIEVLTDRYGIAYSITITIEITIEITIIVITTLTLTLTLTLNIIIIIIVLLLLVHILHSTTTFSARHLERTDMLFRSQCTDLSMGGSRDE